MNTKSPVRKIELSGSFSNMGYEHGEQCRNEIQYLLEERLNILFANVPNLRMSRLEAVCRSMWAYIADRYKELAEELDATAKTAQIHSWQLLLAGAYTDVLDLVRGCSTLTLDECTLGVSTDPRFLAGTWDSHKSAINGLVLIRRRPDVGPETVALTTAGWPAQQGINSNGLAFAISNLTPCNVRSTGLPYIAAVALLASMDTPSDFVHFANSEQFCSGHSYIVLGKEGPGVIVETTGTEVDITTVASVGTKANHYRNGSPIDDNTAYANLPNSCRRETELRSILPDVNGPTDFAQALSNSISLNRTEEHEAAVTCAYFYADPVRMELWYQKGSASKETMKLAKL